MNKLVENEEKLKKKKKNSIIYAALISLLFTVIVHLKLGVNGVKEMMDVNGQWSWGYTALLAAVFLIIFAITLFMMRAKRKTPLTEEEKKEKKGARIEILFIVIDLVMTGSFINLNWEQLSSVGLMWAVVEVVVFFGVVWFIFEFFNRFKFFPKRILKFVTGLLIKVFIPTLFLLLIMLGAYQAKYGYEDIFKPHLIDNAEVFAENMKIAYYNVIITLYDIGQNNPDLWIWLPIAAFCVMVFILLITTFSAKEKDDEEKTAQEVIDEALKDEADEIALEKAYESGEKDRPLLYNAIKKFKEWIKSKEEKAEEAKMKEEELKAKYNVYDVKLMLKQMKGGKTDK